MDGLLIGGGELTEHLRAGYIHFAGGGVLSAVPRGTPVEEVWEYEPYWEIEQFGSPDYRFQMPLTQLEILCYDGYAWVVICGTSLSEQIRRTLPQAQSVEEFYKSTH